MTVDGLPVHATRVLARFRSEETAAQGAGVLNQQGLGVLNQSQLVPGLFTFDLTDANAITAAAAQPLEVQKKELLRKLDALRSSGLFQYVEPDYLVSALGVPTDTAFTNGTLWGLRNTGQSNGVAGVDVGAVSAWDITTGSSNVIVAVVDTGIRYTHQDLVAQMWVNPGEIPGNGIDDDGDGYVDDVYGINAITGSGNPFDDNNHGTHVSGTIGAMANSGGPHVGVTWQVRLMGCKFLGASGSGATSDAIRCIDFATLHGARIMNNSWGGGGFSQALYDSILAARNAGVLFVAAAGNNSSDNDTFPAYPASYQIDNIVAVAAIDRTGAQANFSNYGRNTVHLGAPGVAIYSSTAASDTSYSLFDGTSMATPHVVGVAALLLSQFPGSSLAELKQRLLGGTVPTASLVNTITGGRVNAYNSLTIAADGILEISVNPPSGAAIDVGSNVTVRVTVTDLLPVTNATVTAIGPGGTNYVFLNNGAAPDNAANDQVYSRDIPTAGAATNLPLTIVVTAPGKQPATNSVVYNFIVRPPNDNFANRIALAGITNNATGSNTNATKEAGEPFHAGYSGGKSVWWSWTSPSNGVAVVDTVGSSFDTILGVYTGTTVSNLTTIASNDDGGGGLSSRVTFSAISGTVYQIAVDGFSGSSGQIQLHAGIGGGGGGVPVLTLAEAVDAVNLTWTTGGNASWFGQTSTTHDGVDAAQSGQISHSQQTWMETTVTGPGTLTFWWKVSSESCCDPLTFYMDGISQGDIRGEISWQQRTFSLATGTHTLRWTYSKDGSLVNGSDAAWVDQVSFVPGGGGSTNGVVYLRSTVGSPWGTTANESAMDLAFGVGTWQNLRYETVAASNLFSGASRVIFMEGSDNNATELEAFLTANLASLQSWVSNGGSLFLNAAPNEDNGMSFGFGVNLVYDGVNLSPTGNAAAPAHAIFNGPFLPVGTNWTGTSFAHATITGTGISPLIVNGPPSNALVLAEKMVGAGHVLFGGMTVDSFHSPQPNAHNLRANILAYLNSVAPPISNGAPVIVIQPQSQTVNPGANVALSVGAGGEPPLFYQWRFFGTNLPGATSSNLLVADLQPSRVGPYSVVVSNLYGAVPSSNAVLSLLTGDLHMGLLIYGPIGGNYRIDCQTEAGGAWQTLSTVILPASPYMYVDPTPANTPRRFYRAVYLP